MTISFFFFHISMRYKTVNNKVRGKITIKILYNLHCNTVNTAAMWSGREKNNNDCEIDDNHYATHPFVFCRLFRFT